MAYVLIRRYRFSDIPTVRTIFEPRDAGPCPMETRPESARPRTAAAWVAVNGGGEMWIVPETFLSAIRRAGAPRRLTRTMTRAEAKAHSGPAIHFHGPCKIA